jgi:Mg-chelatase subunit ChlD
MVHTDTSRGLRIRIALSITKARRQNAFFSIRYMDFICPISHQIMKDPVCDKEGNTFDRIFIEEWLQLHGTSPITRTPMTVDDLVPNRVLKDLIEAGVQPTLVSEVKVQSKTKPEIEIGISHDGNVYCISVVPSDSITRNNVDICCVIDISGSMNENADFKNEVGVTESFGLTVLDLVKHAVQTIVQSLGPHDRLALVSFTSHADTILSLTNMDNSGKEAAKRALESLRPMSSTNLWAGLETGLNTLKGSKSGSVLLFTDGVPNVEPPRGHLPMLKLYRDRNDGFSGTINTFGFGYALDSKLLNEIAIEGGGQYAFMLHLLVLFLFIPLLICYPPAQEIQSC